jgi:hypothetical protein
MILTDLLIQQVPTPYTGTLYTNQWAEGETRFAYLQEITGDDDPDPGRSSGHPGLLGHYDYPPLVTNWTAFVTPHVACDAYIPDSKALAAPIKDIIAAGQLEPMAGFGHLLGLLHAVIDACENGRRITLTVAVGIEHLVVEVYHGHNGPHAEVLPHPDFPIPSSTARGALADTVSRYLTNSDGGCVHCSAAGRVWLSDWHRALFLASTIRSPQHTHVSCQSDVQVRNTSPLIQSSVLSTHTHTYPCTHIHPCTHSCSTNPHTPLLSTGI